MAMADLLLNTQGSGGGNAEMVTATLTNSGKTLSAQWSIDAKCVVLMHSFPSQSQNQIWVVNLQDYSWWLAYVPSPYTSGGVFVKQTSRIDSVATWTSDAHSLSTTNASAFSDAVVIALAEFPPAFFS